MKAVLRYSRGGLSLTHFEAEDAIDALISVNEKVLTRRVLDRTKICSNVGSCPRFRRTFPVRVFP